MRSLSLLIIGDEVLAGEVRDDNARWFLERMAEAGVHVAQVSFVRDEAEVIEAEIERLRATAEGLVISGGIGPTHDDLTRQAIAAALGRPLACHAPAVERIRSYYGDKTKEAELAMAEFPAGAVLLDGLRTDTFGIEVENVFALPGVPALFRDLVEGLLGRLEGRVPARAEVLTARREGEVAPLLAEVQADAPEVAIGSYPVLQDGRWHVRIVVRGEDAARVGAVAERLTSALRA